MIATARAIRVLARKQERWWRPFGGILVWGWGMVATRLRLFVSSDFAVVDPRKFIIDCASS